MASKIDTKSKRDRLKVRREPYWDKLQSGGYLGFRRTDNEGNWNARFRDEHGKQNYKSLTLPPHLPINLYDTAASEARKWFDGLSAGAKPKSGTVAEAADAYVEVLRTRNGDAAAKDAKGRIDRYIRQSLGKKRVDKLRRADVESWLLGFVPKEGKPEEIRCAKASANRNFATFKAILNRAYEGGDVTTAHAWIGVKKFQGVDGARTTFLTREQVRKLIGSVSGGFQHLLMAGALTGARYGEICALRAKDFDRAARVLHVQRGKTSQRIIPLTKEMMKFFGERAKAKLPEAHLLTRDDGRPWGHSDQDELMRAAVKEARLPKATVFYTLRHTFIATNIMAGMDIYSVAEVAGTSIEMIERYYGKFLKDRVRDAMTLAAAM